MTKTHYIALLRGINVGGKNIIRMAQLRECLEKAGLTNVSTYIASGNVLFESTQGLNAVEKTFDRTVLEAFGYPGPTVVLSTDDFQTILKEAPAGFGSQPTKYHSDVIFLKRPVSARDVLKDVLALKLKDGVDTAAGGSKALYFTRLSAKRTSSRMSNILKLPSYKSMTIRSWNTAKKLEALAVRD